MSEKTKLSILLSPMTLSMVNDLKSDTDAASHSEVLRNCIRLAFAILSAKNSGAEIWLKGQDGNTTRLAFSSVLALEPEAKEDE